MWNRSSGKAGELVAAGATLAASASDAVTAGPLLIICLTDDRAVRELLEPLADELAGRVLINLTSGTSQEARDLAAWAADRDVTYLDGVTLAIPRPSAPLTRSCSTAVREWRSRSTSRPCAA